MVTTPLPIIDSVVRSVCGRSIEHLAPLAGGGMNETYRVELGDAGTVVVRIARQPTPWFIDEAHLMTRARTIGVPTAEVLGLVHHDHEGELLSFSVQQFLPGRSLMDQVDELPAVDLERLVVDAGEIMARVHSVVPAEDRGIRHELRRPDDDQASRIARTVSEVLDPAAAATVVRGAEFLRREISTRPTPPLCLAQGDFLPKNLLVHDGAVVGVIDWEFAGAAPPAFDLARWEVSAGRPFNDRLDLVRRGYARVADPDQAEAGLLPAFAIDWMLEMLAWQNPATPAQFRRCVELINRYTGN
ncbi:phosphotransferase family protein [Microlunatus parietis]|uniref:Aminoglycoside phosphotransferase (APT) family kinase protein n=1 Tax=Microlunatus parietis TaxID=682979 RepID=A0A7Y9I1V7_9ACTN|nr:phosphotransferase [Microlunatus parietis]NYE68696.1 aminoglycoside phosphotransferase (APT) family kinase protein [Microlunatus parietis]